MRYILPLLLITLALLPASAQACEPCRRILTLEQSIKAADVVVVAKRSDRSGEKQPEFVELTAEAVLKGEAPTGKALKTKSWSGMCAYGVTVEKDSPAVFVLRKNDGVYDSIESGCGVTVLPYENGYITIDNASVGISTPGMEVLSLEAFVKRFLPEKSAPEKAAAFQ